MCFCGKVVVGKCGFGEDWWGGDGGIFVCMWEEKEWGGGAGGCVGFLVCCGRIMPSILISVCLQGRSFDALNKGPNCWSSALSVS